MTALGSWHQRGLFLAMVPHHGALGVDRLERQVRRKERTRWHCSKHVARGRTNSMPRTETLNKTATRKTITESVPDEDP